MVIGVGRPKMDAIPFMHISFAEVSSSTTLILQSTRLTRYQIDLKFINRYHHSWPLAIRTIQHGILDLAPLVTHTFPLERAVEALETAASRESSAMKVHVVDGMEDVQQGAVTTSKL